MIRLMRNLMIIAQKAPLNKGLFLAQKASAL